MTLEENIKNNAECTTKEECPATESDKTLTQKSADVDVQSLPANLKSMDEGELCDKDDDDESYTPTVGERVWTVCVIAMGALFLAACIVVEICKHSMPFCEWIRNSVSSPLRIFSGYLTSWIPFSLGETLVVTLPFAIVWMLVFARHTLARAVRSLVCIMLAVASFVILSFLPLYSGKPVNLCMGFERTPVTESQVEYAYRYTVSNLNSMLSKGLVSYTPDGFSVMPYSFKELSDKVNSAYKKALESEEFSFLTDMDVPAKPIFLSEYMTYTGLSGVYTPFTGEANINTNFPDYVVAFTCAHEIAHQRGVAPEDECSFVAYAVLSQCDDPYLRYAANRYALDYLQNAMWMADSNVCFEIMKSTDGRILNESVAYTEFFEKYRDNTASDIADVINDTSLKINNQEHGIRSYGMMAELVTLYICNNAS